MSLQTLTKEIQLDAKHEVDKVVKAAEAEKVKLLHEAEAERQRILDSAKDTVKKVIEAERSERLTSAQLKAKRLLSETREVIVNEAIIEIWKHFKEIRESANYKDLLEKLAKSGLKDLGSSAKIYANESDHKLLKSFAKNLADEPIHCAGGAIIASSDDKIRINSTLEEIFEQKREEIRKKVFLLLFGSEKKPATKQPEQTKKSARRKK